MSTVERGTFAMELGQNIRRIRTEKNIKLRALAEMAGISASHLCEIEKGTNEPTVSKLQRLAKALRVPINKLIPAA